MDLPILPPEGGPRMDTLPELVGVLALYTSRTILLIIRHIKNTINCIPLECLERMMGMLTEHLSLILQLLILLHSL